MSPRAALVLPALLMAPVPAPAQWLAVDALVAAEVWKTDSGSRLLARNGGDVAVQGYVYAWAVVQASRTVEIRAIGFVSAGTLEHESVEAYGDQLSLRYLPSRAVVLEGGKLLMPVGQFGARRLPHANPLIGSPDKASLRLDQWPVRELSNGQRFPNGYAVAVQGSVLASLTDLLTPRY